jgi:hypothetical protein
VFAGAVQNAALGGTISVLTGDSFANGAKTASAQYLNNAVVMAAPLIWKGVKIAGTTIAKAMVDEAISQVAADFTTDRDLRAKYLSRDEKLQWSRGGMRKLLTGKAWHWAVAERLQSLYPDEFTYNPSKGPDYTHRATGHQVELTTSNPRTYGDHVVRQPGVPISTYPKRRR